MHPIIRWNTLSGTQSSDRTSEQTRLCTSRSGPIEETSTPRMAMFSFITRRATVRLTLTSWGWPVSRVRAYRQLNSRPAPRRYDFKYQVQQLSLQFLQVADRVHHAADFQQRAQVARHLRSRRQLPQQPIRLQVQHFPREDDLRVSGGMAFVKLHRAGRSDPVIFLCQKHECRVAGRNLVSVAQPLLFHRKPVHHGSVAAVQVLDLKSPVFFLAQQAMFPGDGWINDRYHVRWVAPNGRFPVRKRNGGALRGSRRYQQSR